jgi:hypothetical protein
MRVKRYIYIYIYIYIILMIQGKIKRICCEVYWDKEVQTKK